MFSIILPTKNSERTLGKCLDSIHNQSYPQHETIFVDNYSDDDTQHIAESFEGKTDIKIYQKGPERHIQRPFGFEKSSGDVVYFLDSDMYLEKDLISEAIDFFNKNKDYGAIIIPEQNITTGYGYWSRVKAFERELYNNDDTVEAARIFKKETYEKLGGYNQNLISGEDWDLSDRARKICKIGRIKSKVYHDEGEISLWNLLKKKFYYGKKFVSYTNANKGITTSKIYFFRKSFYSNWKKYLQNPGLFLGFFIMINLSFIAGGSGYLIGKIQK